MSYLSRAFAIFQNVIRFGTRDRRTCAACRELPRRQFCSDECVQDEHSRTAW